MKEGRGWPKLGQDDGRPGILQFSVNSGSQVSPDLPTSTHTVGRQTVAMFKHKCPSHRKSMSQCPDLS